METHRPARQDVLKALVGVGQLTLLLVVLAAVFQATNPHPAGWTGWRATSWIAGSLARLMVIASFVGGVVLADRGLAASPRRAVAWVALPIAVTVFFLGEVVQPNADYRALAERGYSAEFLHPFGPDTPLGLAEHLEYAIENPPEEISFSTSRPLSVPASYLAFLLTVSFAYPLVVYPMLLLGYFVGRRTREVRVARRSILRWASGLAAATSFAGTGIASGVWIRANPLSSGVLAGLSALVVTALLAVVVGMLLPASEPSLDDPN